MSPQTQLIKLEFNIDGVIDLEFNLDGVSKHRGLGWVCTANC